MNIFVDINFEIFLINHSIRQNYVKEYQTRGRPLASFIYTRGVKHAARRPHVARLMFAVARDLLR